jgi:hypothetical protein
MNFFDVLVSSIQDPRAGTQKSDLETLLGSLTGGGQNSTGAPSDDAASGLAGAVGSMLKPALREAGQSGGMEGIDALLGSLKQNANSPQELERTIGRERMEEMVGKAREKSGLPTGSIMAMLPIILPALISLLQSGARSGAPAPQAGATAGDPLVPLASNPLLKSFMDSDGDGDVDMTDLVAMGSRFLR